MLGVLRRVAEEPHRSVQQLNADIPAWFAGFVDRLLAKDVGRRFQTAAECAELLERCLAHVQQPAVIPLPEELAGPAPRPRRRRWLVPAVSAVVTVGILLTAWFLIAEKWPLAASSSPPPSGTGNHAAPWSAANSDLPTDKSPTAEVAPLPPAVPWRDAVGSELREIGTELEGLERMLSPPADHRGAN
jgi:hypothetical protein